ncbi:hypothetical protein Aperf_G00000098459 [Anoplocephala perfoliata]
MLGNFLMIMLKRILPQHPDFRVILMSATLNSNKLSEYFGGCPHLEIPGQTFPVKCLYLEGALQECFYICDVVARLKSIDREFYGTGAQAGAIVCPSHSSLTTRCQREAFTPASEGKRKIVIVAKLPRPGGITIEDIVYVVDSGLIKITTYDPRTNTSALAPFLASKANATQRRGRAGQ